MGKTLGFISLKGGVGKTTISAAVATHLANSYHKKILLIDANLSAPNLGLHMGIVSPQKTIHDVLNGDHISSAVHLQYGVDVIPGNFLNNKELNPMLLKDKIGHLKKNYDFVVLDSSPSLNEEMLATIIASDHLFAVSTPDYPTLSCTIRAAQLAKQRHRPIEGIIINQSHGYYDVNLEEIQESTGIPIVAKIKYDEVQHMALAERVPATLFAGKTPLTSEVDRFCRSLLGLPEKTSWLNSIFARRDEKLERVNRAVLAKSFYRGVFKNDR
ncbi:MinD/ParA family protein [Candidatus Pacearchaeota archaeon]|nr:MinD/ParA family protein [Candidatus Pacearchaeota archaeon]